MADCKGVWNQQNAARAALILKTRISTAVTAPTTTTATITTAATIATTMATAASHEHAERVCDEFLQELEGEKLLEERRKKKGKRKKTKTHQPEKEEAIARPGAEEGLQQSGDAMEEIARNLAILAQSQSAAPSSLSSLSLSPSSLSSSSSSTTST
jgi:hypothetical protein